MSAPVVDFENGCDLCGHLNCYGCCPKCNDPACYRTRGRCTDCADIAVEKGLLTREQADEDIKAEDERREKRVEAALVGELAF
jgi:hypothetical protein